MSSSIFNRSTCNLGESYQIISRSLDARGANRGKTPCYHYRVLLDDNGSDMPEKFPQLKPFESSPLIIGVSLAGLFYALRFQEYGIPTIILERGDHTHERMKKIVATGVMGEFNLIIMFVMVKVVQVF